MVKILASMACAISLLISSAAFAGGHIAWKSVAEESRVAFGSVKKNVAGEVHHFNKVSGVVKELGEMTITIDLASLETNIDIRNERMAKHVFDEGKATALITGKIDMDELNGMKAGETKVVDLDAKLSFAGVDTDIEAEMLVARLSENRVLVTTADFILLSTKDLGIDAGVDMLKKLAKLPEITRVVPIAVRMVFQK
ncbi:MAG: YceI family protein [Alphaproteobacteria bacterium]|nr:YceI family protein [Alphaproteobacteria bacterium]